jgi:hypothetical protein
MKPVASRILLILALACHGAALSSVNAHAKSTSTVVAGQPEAARTQTPSKGWLKEMIVNEAQQTTHVTPSVALAVAKIESGFRPHVVSSAGAIGVMQIMPRTGRDVFGLNRTELFDPAVNIRAGVTFLDQLIERYDGRIDLALSHYNGGSRVTSGPRPKIIPATRGYVIKVLAAAQAYQVAGMDGASASDNLHPVSHKTSTPPRQEMAHHTVIPATMASSPHAVSTPWQQHLKEADFWFAAAEASLAAGHQMTTLTTSTVGPARDLVGKLQDNRRAFRHWLKANQ